MLRLQQQGEDLLRGGDAAQADDERWGDGGCFGRGRVGVLIVTLKIFFFFETKQTELSLNQFC